MKLGRIDLGNNVSWAMAPDESLASAIANEIESDPRLSARKLAYSMRIAASTVSYYLANVLGMKYCHLQWLPDTLRSSQKATRVDSAKRTLLALVK
jgi:hypothetical protein